MFRITDYNNSETIKEIGLLPAIGEATDEFEAAALAYKVIAGAKLIESGLFGENTQLVYGAIDKFQSQKIRLDLMVMENENSVQPLWLVRFLYRNEKLAKWELPYFLLMLRDNRQVKILVVHDSILSPNDDHAFKVLKNSFPNFSTKNVSG